MKDVGGEVGEEVYLEVEGKLVSIKVSNMKWMWGLVTV